MSGVGGGIWCNNGNVPTLRGLTSFGKSCEADGNPGVAVKISHFLGWIKATLAGQSNCPESACLPGVCIETVDNADGYHCKGKDPCEDEIDECPSTAECVANKNNDVGYDCLCPAGYEISDDGDCADINECDNNPCGELETCQNNDGGFLCQCSQGTRLDEASVCVDIDECEENPCAENASCHNIALGGGYSCDCPRGYQGDGYSACDEPPQYCGHPKQDGSVKSGVILLGCVPPFKDSAVCNIKCTSKKYPNIPGNSIKCNCIPNGGGCTWDQKGVECTKTPYSELQPTEPAVTTTTVPVPTTTKPPRQCPGLNELYSVMPPVTLDCDKGAPVNGAKCLGKC